MAAGAQQDDRLRRELVTNISHDLRTPLASMQGYIETLIIKDDSLDVGTRRQYLEVARKHATHLGRLIQDLFELAMLDANPAAKAVFEANLAFWRGHLRPMVEEARATGNPLDPLLRREGFLRVSPDLSSPST